MTPRRWIGVMTLLCLTASAAGVMSGAPDQATAPPQQVLGIYHFTTSGSYSYQDRSVSGRVTVIQEAEHSEWTLRFYQDEVGHARRNTTARSYERTRAVTTDYLAPGARRREIKQERWTVGDPLADRITSLSRVMFSPAPGRPTYRTLVTDSTAAIDVRYSGDVKQTSQNGQSSETTYPATHVAIAAPLDIDWAPAIWRDNYHGTLTALNRAPQYTSPAGVHWLRVDLDWQLAPAR